MNSRFPILTFMAGLFRFLGIVVIVLTIVGGLIAIQSDMVQDNPESLVILVLGGLLNFVFGLTLIMIGEAIGVLFAIESNTREAAQHLQNIYQPSNSQPLTPPEILEEPVEASENDESHEEMSDIDRCPTCNAAITGEGSFCTECGNQI